METVGTAPTLASMFLFKSYYVVWKCTITSVFQGYNQQQYLEHVSNISIF